MNRRRYPLTSPIFYAMMGAYFAGAVTFGTTGDDPLPPRWQVFVGGFVIAAVAYALERRYGGRPTPPRRYPVMTERPYDHRRDGL